MIPPAVSGHEEIPSLPALLCGCFPRRLNVQARAALVLLRTLHTHIFKKKDSFIFLGAAPPTNALTAHL